MPCVLIAIDTNSNGEALHDLDVITARILRGKQTEQRSGSASHVFYGSLVVAAKERPDGRQHPTEHRPQVAGEVDGNDFRTASQLKDPAGLPTNGLGSTYPCGGCGGAECVAIY